MSYFDAHAHMTSRTTDDYEAMARAGVRAIIEPAFWLGQPRTNVGSYIDYFSSLIGWERFRASQFGIAHYCAIGLNAKEANDEALAKDVLELLPRFALKEGVPSVQSSRSSPTDELWELDGRRVCAVPECCESPPQRREPMSGCRERRRSG